MQESGGRHLGQGVALVALLALDVILHVQPLLHETLLVGGADDVPALLVIGQSLPCLREEGFEGTSGNHAKECMLRGRTQ